MRLPDPPPAVANAVLGARRWVRGGADRLLPADLAAFDLSNGVAATQVLGALAQLGVADALEGTEEPGRTAAELAAEVGADADALHRLLRTAAALGVLDMDPETGACALTRIGEVLRSDHPKSLRDWCIYQASPATTAAWAGLADAVRTGDSAFATVHGRSVWQHFTAHPDEERRFAGAMRRLTAGTAEALASAFPWPAGAIVCDVGGGIGTLLAAILEHDVSLSGVVVDAPGVLAEAEAFLEDRGVRDRVDLLAGDLFTAIPASADVYVLKDVLHDWDDARCATILATVRAAAPERARVVLVETLQEWARPHPFAWFEDLQMLTQCDGGRQRSVAELHALLADAGFEPGRVRETLSHALVEGRLPAAG